MTQNRLNISKPLSQRHQRREEARIKFEELWLKNPEQFNPLRNVMERERLKRTWELIEEYFVPQNKRIVDIGCGRGVLAQRLCEGNAQGDVLDVALSPLKTLQSRNIKNLSTHQDYMPKTQLLDEAYDLAICTEVIADLYPDDYRLFFSELSRIIKPNGYVVCSTALDIGSEDALQRFATLSETEFKIEKWVLSYHHLYVRLIDIFLAPGRFVKAYRDDIYRNKEIKRRRGMARCWFQVNTTPLLATIWGYVNVLIRPLISLIQQSPRILKGLEKISHFLWSEAGVSHAIWIGTRRPLVETSTAETLPQERKHKKEVWE